MSQEFKIVQCKDLGLNYLHYLEKMVVISGWVDRIRDHGAITFIDLRDTEDYLQIVFNENCSEKIHRIAKELKQEYVIEVRGKIVKREDSVINKAALTGYIELIVEDIKILNEAHPLPFQVNENVTLNEELRLKYRYLDLRRSKLKDNFKKRYLILHSLRNQLHKQNFIEIETPILNKSTPEGARDFLIPSRLHPGYFYALPQSPQIFKQILMIAGFGRYYQIARCFRDEDLRSDRQPEFTQFDMEMSFIDENQIMTVIENILAKVLKEVYQLEIHTPFKCLSYSDSMRLFGSDKPDTRFDLKFHDLSAIFSQTDFKIFKDILEKNGKSLALFIKNRADSFSRKELDLLIEFVQELGAKGLVWIKYEKSEFNSNIKKFLTDTIQNSLKQTFQIHENDIIFIITEEDIQKAYKILGSLRLKLGKDLNFIDPNRLEFTWITQFPLFEYNEEMGELSSVHHPFTMPDLSPGEKLSELNLTTVRSKSYDLVLNGQEIGGGSIRIHKADLQRKIFEFLKIPEYLINEKFNFFLDALKYGTPPHGGFALGLDRFVMILQKAESIREVIAFPKTQKGTCLMMNTPNPVLENQLKELHIRNINVQK